MHWNFQRLDYERSKGPRYFFTIKAANVHLDPDLDYLGPLDDKAEVVVKVIDVDEPPEFTKADYEFFGEPMRCLRWCVDICLVRKTFMFFTQSQKCVSVQNLQYNVHVG